MDREAFKNTIPLASSGLTLRYAPMLQLKCRLILIGLAFTYVILNNWFNSQEGLSDSELTYHLHPLLFILGTSVASLVWFRSGRSLALFGRVQIAIDLALVTTLVVVTGGPLSPFVFMYVVLVIGVAMLASRDAAIVTAFISSLAFASGTIALRFNLTSPPNIPEVLTLSLSYLGMQWAALSGAMFVVAFATSFLIRRVATSYELIKTSQRDLAAMHHAQNALMDGIQDGIVTTDASDVVTFMNQHARELFNLSQQDEAGPFSRFLKRRGLNVHAPIPIGESEVELSDGPQQQKRRILIMTKALLAADGTEIGRLYQCQDVTRIRSIEDQLQMQEQLARLLAEQPSETTDSGKAAAFVGESRVMQQIFKLIDRAAPSDATVLINGESGTGKELVARALHQRGSRSNGPFVPVNCGAIPETLIESELFGHKRGAFTGADTDTIGLFRKAQGGTIFLDEIGELPLPMQVKLLRTLQEKSVRPVGANIDIPFDVRVIAATNRNLRGEVSAGRFREDLFYRLNVINIQLPPLRERKEDLPLLITSALRRLVKKGKAPVITPAAMELLLGYGYPGNVRELENILERAIVLGGEVVLPEHLPEQMRETKGCVDRSTNKPFETEVIVDEQMTLPINLDELLLATERRYIEAALLQTNGAKKKAAELLGINFRSFRYRLQKLSPETAAAEGDGHEASS